jgi:hypothetical protein
VLTDDNPSLALVLPIKPSGANSGFGDLFDKRGCVRSCLNLVIDCHDDYPTQAAWQVWMQQFVDDLGLKQLIESERG